MLSQRLNVSVNMLKVLIHESNAFHRRIYFRSAAAVYPVARVAAEVDPVAVAAAAAAAAAAIAVPNVVQAAQLTIH